MSEFSRRRMLGGIGALFAAPAIVRASSLMPVRGIIMPKQIVWRKLYGGQLLTIEQIRDQIAMEAVLSFNNPLLQQIAEGGQTSVRIGAPA